MRLGMRGTILSVSGGMNWGAANQLRPHAAARALHLPPIRGDDHDDGESDKADGRRLAQPQGFGRVVQGARRMAREAGIRPQAQPAGVNPLDCLDVPTEAAATRRETEACR